MHLSLTLHSSLLLILPLFSLFLCIATQSLSLASQAIEDNNASIRDECHEREICDCGEAAKPYGSIVTDEPDSIAGVSADNRKHYEHNSRVRYRCADANNQLVGNDVRVCKRGKWFDTVPRCAINYLNETELTFIEILGPKGGVNGSTVHITNRHNNNGAYSVPLDSQPQQCLKWETSEGQLWILHVNQYVSVHFIKITLYADNLKQYWREKKIKIRLQLNNLWGIKCFNLRPFRSGDTNDSVYNSSEYSSSSSNRGGDESDNFLTLDLLCESHQAVAKQGNGNSEVHSIFVTFLSRLNLTEPYSMSLCDLRLYHFADECGTPDIPLTTRIRESDTNQKQYLFECHDKGDVIEGSPRVKCGSKGKWLNDAPICAPRAYCHALASGSVGDNVKVTYEFTVDGESREKLIPNGKIANISCDVANNSEAEYHLIGSSQLICRNGRWLGLNQKPVCRPFVGSAPHSDNDSNTITSVFLAITVIALVVLIAGAVIRSKRQKPLNRLEPKPSTKSINDYDDIDLQRDRNYPQIGANINNGYVDFNQYQLDMYDGVIQRTSNGSSVGSKEIIGGELVEMSHTNPRPNVVNKCGNNKKEDDNKKSHIYLAIH